MISTSDIQEYQSFVILQKFLSKENIMTNFCKIIDYGIDGQIELLTHPPNEDFYEENKAIKGDLRRRIDIQVKSTRKIKNNKDGSVSYQFKLEHIRLWKNSPIPVIVFLIDLCSESEDIYWKFIDEEIKIRKGNETKMSLRLHKIERGCWIIFDSLINKFYSKKEIIPHVSSILPMFKDFIERREQGLKIRDNLLFQELNTTVNPKCTLLSKTPKSGLRTYINYEEFAISAEYYYKSKLDTIIFGGLEKIP